MIQKISFTANHHSLTKPVVKKAEEKFVNAAMNLANTKNAEKAAQDFANAKIYSDAEDLTEKIHSYCSASMNLADTKNAKKAAEDLKKAEFAKDDSTLGERVESFNASRAQHKVVEPEVKEVPVETEPETNRNGLNFFG